MGANILVFVTFVPSVPFVPFVVRVLVDRILLNQCPF
jgi:hypothetical protein